VGRPERLADLIAAVALAIVAILALWTFRDYGLGWDDYTHAQYGQLLLGYYQSGLTDKRALSFVNLFMYGGGFDMAAGLLDRVTPFDLFETRRLLGAAVGLVGLAAVWRIGRRLGGPVAGLLALLLLATCPLYYGHMFINPKDAPFAVAMTVLLLALVRALDEYPKPSTGTLVLFAAGLGFSVGSRILGGMSALYMIVPIGMLMWTRMRVAGASAALREFGRFALLLLPGVIGAYVIMALVWPWSVQEPLNPFRAIGYFSHFFEKPWKEMFEGVPISVPDMPRSYVPLLFALKLPEILLAFGLAGAGGAILAAWRDDIPIRHRAIYVLLVFAALTPVAIAVATRPAMYNGIRHFVFVVPPFAVLGSLAGAWIIRRLGGITAPRAIAAAWLMAAALLVPVTDMVRIHPYQYASFNRISGGIYEADERYMLDYWGLAFKEAAQQLRAKLTENLEVPPKRRWRIAVCGPHASAEVELGPEFSTTWDPKGADFAMMLGSYYCAELDAPVLVEVEREDVIFARVYDIRGRTITNLFNPASSAQ